MCQYVVNVQDEWKPFQVTELNLAWVTERLSLTAVGVIMPGETAWSRQSCCQRCAETTEWTVLISVQDASSWPTKSSQGRLSTCTTVKTTHTTCSGCFEMDLDIISEFAQLLLCLLEEEYFNSIQKFLIHPKGRLNVVVTHKIQVPSKSSFQCFFNVWL